MYSVFLYYQEIFSVRFGTFSSDSAKFSTVKNISNYNTHEGDINTYKSDFCTLEYNFHPHSLILHAKCDFYTQVSNFDTYECDYDTLACDLYMQSVISTRTSVNSTLTRLVSVRIVRFSHAECDFTRKVCFLHTQQ
jgi:hypothetical protein